jgi:hypothetical protein
MERRKPYVAILVSYSPHLTPQCTVAVTQLYILAAILILPTLKGWNLESRLSAGAPGIERGPPERIREHAT